MNRIGLLFALCFSTSLLLSCSTPTVPHNDSKPTNLAVPTTNLPSNLASISIASWNVEHLAFPIDMGCKPRTLADIEKLKAYAQALQADVVALQEVASIEALALLFSPDQWQLIISPRPDSEPYTCRESGRTSTQQKLAFAIKKSLNVKQISAFDELSLGLAGLRYGLEIELESDFGPLSLLNVHLKSGCFVDELRTSDKEACKVLAQQAPVLDNWIEQKEQQGKPYVLLGDFNHRLSTGNNQLAQELLDDSQGARRSIVNTGAELIGCHPYYPAPIDHILLGNLNSAEIEYKAKFHLFEDMQVDAMLSDHCAISTTLSQTKYQAR
jgi:endonuclease/exonuclease/phosphatase family metal-dependent hydrolase